MNIKKVLDPNGGDPEQIAMSEAEFEKSLPGEMGRYMHDLRENNISLEATLNNMDQFKNKIILDYVAEAIAHAIDATNRETKKEMCHCMEEKEKAHGRLIKF